MAATTQTQTVVIPMASNQGQQGTATRGAHHNAYIACPKFDTNATLALVPGTGCPWRPNTLGYDFYQAVLAHNPATVGAAIQMGAKAKLTARAVQNHLRWLYTWGAGAYLLVNGQRYAQAPNPNKAVAPVAPVAKPAKGKGKVKVTA